MSNKNSAAPLYVLLRRAEPPKHILLLPAAFPTGIIFEVLRHHRRNDMSSATAVDSYPFLTPLHREVLPNCITAAFELL